ncbi:7TMR-DISM extracellular 2 [Alteromonadaceae bacterium Bs31]|nr:7TMR-DISM extracellular 2 [Alteromonadaceae bacterium Bs31]
MYRHSLAKLSFLLAICIQLAVTNCFADSGYISFDAYYFNDEGANSTIQDVLRGDSANRFIEPQANGLSFGWVDTPYWVKLQIIEIKDKQALFLEIPWPLLDELNIYLVDSENTIISSYALGDHQYFSQRPIFDAQFVVPVDFSTQAIETIYFQVQTSSSLQLPIRFWTQEDYLKHRAKYLSTQGIFYGLLLVMTFYNLFIYFSTRRVAYLHYVCFVVSFSTLQLGLKGVGFQFIWPNIPQLNDYAIATGGSFCLLFLTLFARSFLQLDETPALKKVNNYMLVLAIIFILLSMLVPYRVIITPLTVSVLICSIIVIIKATLRYRQGFREARFYLVAWITMVVGCFIYLFKQLGFFPINYITENSLQIGSAFEIVLLSLALADRLNTLQSGLKTANERLEQEVSDRTQELLSALEKLGNVNTRLSVISITDGLTGLHNRYHFDSALQKTIEKMRSIGGTVSLLILDIDHFKKINDTWGHLLGDKALQWVGDSLCAIKKRKADVLCRYGGEEFAIIMPDTDNLGASNFAENIRQEMEASHFYEEGVRIPITISIGIASLPATTDLEPDKLIKAADIALYGAKNYGRNCVHIFTGEIGSVLKNNDANTSSQRVKTVCSQ